MCLLVKIIFLFLFLFTSAVGGEIYQCGNLFQDHPCAGAKVIGSLEKDEKADEQAKAKIEELKKIEEQTLKDADARYQSEVAAAEKARKASFEHANAISAIKENKVVIGQTGDQVIKSWGSPIRKNSSDNGQVQQWVYVNGDGSRQYVYFRDGKVTGWN